MTDIIVRLKLFLLAWLLKWFHGYYLRGRDEQEWIMVDHVRGLVYLHRRDKWRR